MKIVSWYEKGKVLWEDVAGTMEESVKAAVAARTEQMRVECAGCQRRGNALGVCLTDSPSTFLPSGRPNKIVGPTGGHHQ